MTAEYWQRQGFELVMRLGSEPEKESARARRAYVLEIHRQTEAWFASRAEQNKEAA